MCSKCKVERSLNEFGRHRRRKDGLNGECKCCVNKRSRERYKTNGEYYKAKREEFKEKNPDYFKQYRLVKKNDNV